MKAKKFNGKLVLKKKTIVNLNGSEMENVQGGSTESCMCAFTYQKSYCSAVGPCC